MKLNTRTKGISLSYLYYILNVVLTILVSAFIIRRIGKTNYGVFQAMTAFVSYLVLLEFGTATLMTRNISLLKRDGSDNEDLKKNVSTIWSLTIVLSLFVVLASLAFYLFIPSIYQHTLSPEQIILGKKIFIFAAANLLLTFLTSTLNGLILAYEQYVFEKIITIARLVLRSVLVISLLYIKQDVLIVVIVDCALGLASFLATLFYCIFKYKASLVFKYFDKTILKQCLPLAFAMLLQTLVNTANGVVDKFLISIMMTPDDVSVYSVSMTIFNMFSSIATLPVVMFLPSIANHVKNGLKGDKLTEKLVESCRLNTIVMGLIMFGFLLIGKEFIKIVYGDGFVEAWIYSVIVIIPMFFNMTNAVIVNVLDLYNKRQVRSLILLGTTLLNVLITIFGIKFFGMIGAASGTAIATILQTIILNYYYKKRIGINVIYLFKRSYKGIVASLIFAFVISLPFHQRITNDYINLFVSGLLFVVSFLVILWSIGLTKEEKKSIAASKFFSNKCKQK